MKAEYHELIQMKEENPEKAQEIVRDLSLKHTDRDLANIWDVTVSKVGNLRRDLGIMKNSGGNIQAIYPPGSYTPETGFRKSNAKKKEPTFVESEVVSDRESALSLNFSNLTKEQIKNFISLIESLPEGKYDLKLEVKSKESKSEDKATHAV